MADDLALAVDVEEKEDAFAIAKMDSFLSQSPKVGSFRLSPFIEVALLIRDRVVAVVTVGYLIISWV